MKLKSILINYVNKISTSFKVAYTLGNAYMKMHNVNDLHKTTNFIHSNFHFQTEKHFRRKKLTQPIIILVNLIPLRQIMYLLVIKGFSLNLIKVDIPSFVLKNNSTNLQHRRDQYIGTTNVSHAYNYIYIYEEKY